MRRITINAFKKDKKGSAGYRFSISYPNAPWGYALYLPSSTTIFHADNIRQAMERCIEYGKQQRSREIMELLK